MKPLIMLTIAGVVMSIWCATGQADRLYTWEDDNGVTHISKEPPPQKTKLVDIMDYTATPANKNHATGKQVSNEGESSQPKRIGAQEREKASGATATTEVVDEDVDEDVYYDGDRRRRRKIRHEERAERREKGENGQENDQRFDDRLDRKENREARRDARQEERENRRESDRSIRRPHRRR